MPQMLHFTTRVSINHLFRADQWPKFSGMFSCPHVYMCWTAILTWIL